MNAQLRVAGEADARADTWRWPQKEEFTARPDAVALRRSVVHNIHWLGCVSQLHACFGRCAWAFNRLPLRQGRLGPQGRQILPSLAHRMFTLQCYAPRSLADQPGSHGAGYLG